MKKLLLLVAVMFWVSETSAQISGFGTSKNSPDFSSFSTRTKEKLYTLSDVILKKEYRAIRIKVEITSLREGSIIFTQDGCFLGGEWGTLHPEAMYIGEKQWTLGKHYRYEAYNKGKYVMCTFLFDRIPAGISSVSFATKEFEWGDIQLTDNPNPVAQSNWTEDSLKNHWRTNGFDKIEGIYTFIECSKPEWWGKNKHTLGIIKNNDEYDVVYLKGSNHLIWERGEVKGHIMKTAIKGLYKVAYWFLENKIENEDFYVEFEGQGFSIYESEKSISAHFLKLFPDAEMIEQSQGGNHRIVASPSNSETISGSGSGVIISRNGIIATNYHVINQASTIEVWVNHNNKVESFPAKVLCSDKENDLTLLQIESNYLYPFEPIPYSILSKGVEVGSSVLAMGYPVVDIMGEEVKITDGIISSKTGYEGKISTYQISAPIQPGNSGGPLFDKNGNLIGICQGGIMSGQNIGYAIKSNYLLNLIESAPIKIDIPEKNELSGLDIPEQVRKLSKYVVCIKYTRNK